VPVAFHSILTVKKSFSLQHSVYGIFYFNECHAFYLQREDCFLRLTKQTASGSASAVIGFVDGAKRDCALATVGEHYFAKPAEVKQAVGGLEAEKTQGTSFALYSVLKRRSNVAITFLTTAFNAAPSRWCLSQHARFTHLSDERAPICVLHFATCLLTRLESRLRRRGLPRDKLSSSGPNIVKFSQTTPLKQSTGTLTITT